MSERRAKWLDVAGQTLPWALLVLLAAVTLLNGSSVPERPDITTFDTVLFQPDGPAPGGARRVTLPHEWRRDPAEITAGWYRVNLDFTAAPRRPQAVYLPSASLNAAVYVNGYLVGSGGRMEAPISRHRLRPYFFHVPPTLWSTGPNEIAVRVVSAPVDSGWLRPFYVGPAGDLLPAYERRVLLRVTWLQVVAAMMLTLAVVFFALGWRRRSDPVYGWFGAVLLSLGAYCLILLAVEPPLSNARWDALRVWSMGPLVVSIIGLVHRYLHYDRPGIERLAIGLCALALPALLLMPEPWFYAVGKKIYVLGLVTAGLYPAACGLTGFRRVELREMLPLWLSGLWLLGWGFQIAFVEAELVPRGDKYLAHLGAPPVMLVFGFILLRRFVRAMNESETLNRELEQRVADKSRELEDNYRRLRELELERAIADERRRVLADMHDGVGGSLSSALALLDGREVPAGRVRAAVSAALTDLRLIIEAFDGTGGGDLGLLLAPLRERLAAQARAHEMTLHWDLADDIPPPGGDPSGALALLRFVQEAVTNACRHSGGKSVKLRARADGAQARLEILDDGEGFDPGRVERGRGLNNLAQRAHQLGAELVLGSGDGGGRVILSWAQSAAISSRSQGKAKAPQSSAASQAATDQRSGPG